MHTDLYVCGPGWPAWMWTVVLSQLQVKVAETYSLGASCEYLLLYLWVFVVYFGSARCGHYAAEVFSQCGILADSMSLFDMWTFIPDYGVIIYFYIELNI